MTLIGHIEHEKGTPRMHEAISRRPGTAPSLIHYRPSLY